MAATSHAMTYHINTARSLSKSIQPNFVGYSLEVSGAPIWLGKNPEGTKPSFVRLMHQLMMTPGQKGPLLRIGGNSADVSVWNPSNEPLPEGDTYSISPVDLVVVNNAVTAIDSMATFGLNMRSGANSSYAVQHAQAINRYIGWTRVAALEIGNENDLFYENGIRTSTYSYSDYEKEFAMYVQDIAKHVPVAPKVIIQGLTVAGRSWLSHLDEYSQKFQSILTSISLHNYPLTHCSGHNATIAQLLSDSSAQTEAQSIISAGYVSALDALSLPLVMGELNSASCGGMPGVSNVFASALWVVDYLFNLAHAGVRHVNFHGGGGVSGYTSLSWPSVDSDQPSVQPIFYGQWLFARATRDFCNLVETTSSTFLPSPVRVWSCWSSPRLTVTIIHKNQTSPRAVISLNVTSPYLDFSFPSARLFTLVAPSLTEERNLTVAGLTWAKTKDGTPDGELAGQLITPTIDDGWATYSFVVAPASAALFEWQDQVPDTIKLSDVNVSSQR